MDQRRTVLGLLGGIGAGKSHVARKIAELVPSAIVDADVLAHRVLDTCARDGRLEEALGPGLVTAEGKPDRKRIAERVFSDAAALRALERVTHPPIQALIVDRVQTHRRGHGEPLLVLDVPLLFEVGLDRSCDVLWFIEVPDELRKQRAAKNGLTPEEVDRRERHQTPLERKRARADLVIRNDVDDATLTRTLAEALARLGVAPASRR
jgi:dephospho-CoA kinase